MTALLGCPIGYAWIPSANPYRLEQTIVAVLLVVGFIVWRRVKPTPGPFIHAYILCASISTVALSTLHTSDGMREARQTSWLVLQLTAGLVISMYAAILRTLQERRERALPRMRVSRDRAAR